MQSVLRFGNSCSVDRRHAYILSMDCNRGYYLRLKKESRYRRVAIFIILFLYICLFLVYYKIQKKILRQRQQGFRKGKSTINAIHLLQTWIRPAYNFYTIPNGI